MCGYVGKPKKKKKYPAGYVREREINRLDCVRCVVSPKGTSKHHPQKILTFFLFLKFTFFLRFTIYNFRIGKQQFEPFKFIFNFFKNEIQTKCNFSLEIFKINTKETSVSVCRPQRQFLVFASFFFFLFSGKIQNGARPSIVALFLFYFHTFSFGKRQRLRQLWENFDISWFCNPRHIFDHKKIPNGDQQFLFSFSFTLFNQLQTSILLKSIANRFI